MTKWLDSYYISIAHFDDKHQEIISKINEYLDASLFDKEKHLVNDMLETLGDYAVRHVVSEEQEMLKYTYAEFLEHMGFQRYFWVILLNLDRY